MNYHERIHMLRDYDRGVGLVEGETIEVGYESSKLDPGQAEALCRPAADDGGPFAEPVRNKQGDEESNVPD